MKGQGPDSQGQGDEISPYGQRQGLTQLALVVCDLGLGTKSLGLGYITDSVSINAQNEMNDEALQHKVRSLPGRTM